MMSVTLSSSIDELDLPLTLYSALRRNQIFTVEQLVALGPWDVRRMRGVGPVSVTELELTLEAHGLRLTGKPESPPDPVRNIEAVVESAGPLGVPAARIHPDDELPNTWRITEIWEHEGQRGAYVVWTDTPGSWRHAGSPTWGQIVYSADVKRYDKAHVGSRICAGVDALVCSSCVVPDRRSDEVDAARRLAYYDGLGLPIRRLDFCARKLKGTPAWDALPDPMPADDALLVKFWAVIGPEPILSVHPDSIIPAHWQRLTIDGEEWLYSEPDDWMHIRLEPTAKLSSARGVSALIGQARRKMHTAIYEAEQGTKSSHPAVRRPTVASSPRAADAPPARGVQRAEWLGQQITMMASAESNTYEAHTRRRIAAHRALALLNGYQPEDPENDGMTLYGTLSLHLAGLNEMARRAFDGENGDSDAVL
jgi:hypothetical protein